MIRSAIKEDDDVWWLPDKGNYRTDQHHAILLEAIAQSNDMSRMRVSPPYTFGVTAICRAVALGLHDICELLLDHCGIDPNAVCYTEWICTYTPLEYVSWFGTRDAPGVMKIILRYGGNPTLIHPSHAYETSVLVPFQRHCDIICATVWVMRAIPGAIWRDLSETVVDRMKKLDF